MGEKSKHVSITPKHIVENRNNSPAVLCGSKMLEMTVPGGLPAAARSASAISAAVSSRASRQPNNGRDAGIDS